METETCESILSEISREFGSVSPFWRTMSASREVIRSYWRAYTELLAWGEIPKRTKLMVAYECALADGCPKCSGGFTKLLRTVGIDEPTIKSLERGIRSSSLDDETREVLIYAYRAAKDPHGIDDRTVDAFTHLLGKEKVVEAVAWVNECKMLIDTAHSLNLHPLE